MNINIHDRGGVRILYLKGKITLGAGEMALRQSLQEVLSEGATKIVFNLKDVTTVDSTGIGELVGSYTTATNRGAKLKLSNLPTKMQELLIMTQLITVFDVYDSEDEAVGSF